MVELRNDGLPKGIAVNMTDEEADLLQNQMIMCYISIAEKGNRAKDEMERKIVEAELNAWSRLVFRLHYFHPSLLRPCELEEEAEKTMKLWEGEDDDNNDID